MQAEPGRLPPPRIPAHTAGREHELPAPVDGGLGVLPGDSPGQHDAPAPVRDISSVLRTHALHVGRQARANGRRQRDHAVLCPFPLSHGNDIPLEVDVLHTQIETFTQPKASPVQQHPGQPGDAREPGKNRPDLAPVEHDRQTHGLPRPHDTVQARQADSQNLPVQEHERMKRLVLSRCADPAPHGKSRKKRCHLGRPHLSRVASRVEADEPPDPPDIGLLGPRTEVSQPARLPDFVEQHRPGRGTDDVHLHDSQGMRIPCRLEPRAI